MELKTLQQALRSIPEVSDPAPRPADEVVDIVGAALEFSKLLRKTSVQQSREVREIASSIPDFEEIRQAWQREQQRATSSEQQLRRLAEVYIDTLDILDRMLDAFAAAPQMKEWEQQLRQAVDVCRHNAQKAGLVTLGSPGEPFDGAIHDLTRQVPPTNSAPIKVGNVNTRGYALNGKVLRRATVDYAS